MSIKARQAIERDMRPRLTVIGVGGAGCNAVNNMIAAGLTGVNFVVANTDAQSLAISTAEFRIQLGASLTEGLGAGSKPEIGEAAAEEAIGDIREVIEGSHMVFIAAGMGGGTGTGAAAVIARTAREMGILTVAVVTKPFQFEGARRMRTAEDGIHRLRDQVDTLIVIPNQNLFRISNDKTTFAEAFILADQVLYSGVACVVDLIVKEGLINLDFADVRTVMSGMGTAMMGTGEASGPGRATAAAEEAISNPLLDDVTLNGAKGLLLSITGGQSLTLYEVDEAATRVRQEVDPEANVIVGATFDDTLEDKIRVSIVASGLARQQMSAAPPVNAMPAPAMPPLVSPVPAAMAPAPQNYGVPDVHSRISDALSRDPFAPAPQPPIEAQQPAPQAGWMAPGNVMIEEASSGGYAPFDPPAYTPRAYQDRSQLQPDPAFQPMPPVEARRPRRMPEIQDFPPVGQRAYNAANGAAPKPQETEEAPRRGGWFSRFTRRGSDASDSASNRPARSTGTSSQSLVQGGGQPPPATAPQIAPGAQTTKAQETPELPVFFGNRRR